MAKATKGDTVRIHYTGRLEDGTVFDSSREREPLSFTLGEGEVIPGFENAVEGMEEGETSETELASEDAYGPRRDDLILTLPREQLPPDVEAEEGTYLQLRTQDGQDVPVRVVDVTEEDLRVDANHPLAGRDLTFEIELVGVES